MTGAPSTRTAAPGRCLPPPLARRPSVEIKIASWALYSTKLALTRVTWGAKRAKARPNLPGSKPVGQLLAPQHVVIARPRPGHAIALSRHQHLRHQEPRIILRGEHRAISA